MHWQAIRRSTRLVDQGATEWTDGMREEHDDTTLSGETLTKQNCTTTTDGRGSGNTSSATDVVSTDIPTQSPVLRPVNSIDNLLRILNLWKIVNAPAEDPPKMDNNEDRALSPSAHDTNEPSSADDMDDQNFLPVDIPGMPAGLSTFEHERAMRNRIQRHKIDRDAVFDKHKYTPTFLHDCLMLPGSLANVIGKQSPVKLVRSMTPALMPGFQTYSHPQTNQPCLLQSPGENDYVQGMLLFGQGHEARDCIHEHYRPHAKRIKVQVEVELLSPSSDSRPQTLFRKKIWANAWLWRDITTFDGLAGRDFIWTLDAYLSGSLGAQRSPRIVKASFVGDECLGDDEQGEHVENYTTSSSGTILINHGQSEGLDDTGWPLNGSMGLDYERS